jgi:hypothetical protein
MKLLTIRYEHQHYYHPDERTAEHNRWVAGMLSTILANQENDMIDTTKILAATTRATTDSAALRALVKDVKTSLDKSIADLAAAIANSDPVAMAKAQADIDQAAGLLDTDSTETEAALAANVPPTPTP